MHLRIDVSTAEANSELESVLASAPFARSARLASLLSYLCTKYFAGEADQIKEYSIGVEVLLRPPSFDPANDAGARVEVHRLRRRLQKYYETEGASRKLRIEIPVGHYVPAFVPNVPAGPSSPPALGERPDQPNLDQPNLDHPNLDQPNPDPSNLDHSNPDHSNPDHSNEVRFGLVADILAHEREAGPRKPKTLRTPLIAVGLVLVVGAVLLQLSRRTVHGSSSTIRETPAAAAQLAVYRSSAPSGVLPGSAVRLGCGHTVSYTDRSGQIWAADRYYEGGTPVDSPRQYVARAFDSRLFQNGRSGDFSYQIPLAKGVYELRLGFVETTYGPGTAAGGGEYSRTFDVNANGRPLLAEFDIYSDANGTNVADLRVFKDISPGPDGFLHLEFRGHRGPALINFIEVVPAQPHRLNPIRIVAQENFLTEASGIVWSPDTSVTGGQLAGHSVQVAGTGEPDVYGRERYGHFEYALPVDLGTYSLSLHFAEEYFGPGNPGGGGFGSRLFDVFCNGAALLRNYDVFREAGMNHALVKTFHGLTPNAQGKLVVSFLPVRNYASLYALEVLDESK